MQHLLVLISDLFQWFAHHSIASVHHVSRHERLQLRELRALVRTLAYELFTGVGSS
jgi:hypothetical protein